MSPQSSWSETILVVEDAEAVRKMVCAMLAAGGYQCVEAADGQEALQIVEDGRHSFALVLTDMVMPKMSGLEFARHLGRIRPDVRVVFMSGYTEEPLLQRVERPAAFLPKPFTAATLLNTVRRSLDRRVEDVQ